MQQSLGEWLYDNSFQAPRCSNVALNIVPWLAAVVRCSLSQWDWSDSTAATESNYIYLPQQTRPPPLLQSYNLTLREHVKIAHVGTFLCLNCAIGLWWRVHKTRTRDIARVVRMKTGVLEGRQRKYMGWRTKGRIEVSRKRQQNRLHKTSWAFLLTNL